MGIDYNTYIGPYLTAKIRSDLTKTIDCCGDHGFENSMNFCPKCGKSRQDRFLTIRKDNVPDFWQENYNKGLFYDYLICTSSLMDDSPAIDVFKTYVYIPNRYWSDLKIPIIAEGEITLDFSMLGVKESISKFKALFADEIQYLKKWFEVKVHFGYTSYYS